MKNEERQSITVCIASSKSVSKYWFCLLDGSVFY